MTSFRSDLLRTLDERGFIHQCTDAEALDALASSRQVTAYIGFDCTANSLHIGNLVGIMTLRIVQQTGHRAIALVGGGTTKIGDPSGKDESRQLLTEEIIEANKAGIKRSLSAFLDFGEDRALLVDNAEWLDQLHYVPFLRDFGAHFTINRMLAFDFVKSRLEREQPLSLLEFNYMVMQAYDFVELNRRLDCRLQMGGSDQWGNIVNGVELGRRVDGKQLFGLTTPLITTASGAKMGKTAAGAVWLNEDHLPPFDYWQFWRNTEDADVGRFLKIFTDLPMEEIARLEKLEGADLNEAKRTLATAATALCHGQAAAEEAESAARAVFEQGGADTTGLPSVAVDAAALQSGISITELFVSAGLAASNGEARRLVRGGGARINDQRIASETMLVHADMITEGHIKLSAGKKRHIRVVPG